MANLLLGVIYLFICFLLGYRISKKLLLNNLPVMIFVGFILINFIIPFTAFMFGILFKVNINYLTVFAAIILIYITTITKNNIKINKSINLISLGIGILIFIIYFLSFRGPFLGYWDTYIASPAMIMTGEKVEFVDFFNQSLYNYELTNTLPNDLVNNNAYGIISKDQRLGSGIVFAVPYLFFGHLGFRLFHALFLSLSSIIFYYLIKFILGKDYIAAIGQFVLFLNSYILSINTLNPNLLGMVLSIIIIYLLIQKQKSWIWIGCIYGLFGGIRNVAVIFCLGIGYNILKERKILISSLKFAFGVLLLLIPILFWNNYAYHNPLLHSSQFEHFEGFRPMFKHSFFGQSFDFNGLFNYPLTKNIIRTPHYYFPVYLYLFLLLINIFGMSIVFITIGTQFKKGQNDRIIFLLLLIIPFLLFLSLQENWETAKTTFILLILPAITILLCNGIYNFFNHFTINKTKILVISLVVIILLLNISQKSNYEFDQRWYNRFPKAYENTYDKYPIKLNNNEFIFFQTKESNYEIEKQKKELTSINLLPNIMHLENIQKIDIIEEISTKNKTVLAIWKYIYAPLNNK